jgi:UDP-N-acetylmuramoylalanine--D-glutamate ligase
MKIDDLKDKKILILGMGREGLATFKYIRKKLPDQLIGLADQDQKTIDKIGDTSNTLLEFGDKYLDGLNKYDVVIKTPGLSPRTRQIEQAKANGVVFTSATNLFFAEKKGKVIGVSGTKGKSTTTSLIFEILKKARLKSELIGNIGKPAIDFLKDDHEDKIYVFEMSSYQLEDFDGRLDMAVLISFFPEHLDYHQNIEKYFDAKSKLLLSVKENGVIIYNAGFEKINGFIKKMSSEFLNKAIDLVGYGGETQYRVEENDLMVEGVKKLTLDEVRLLGAHNLENMLAASLTAKKLHIDEKYIWEALKQFQGLEHRLEYVGMFKGIHFYNDSISTTPESGIAALEAIGKGKIDCLIAGGIDRGYEFENFAKKINEFGLKAVILFPETGEKIAKNLNENIEKINVGTMEEAVKKAYENCSAGQVCLLSPASPSYNLFVNFEDRGNQFKEMVKKLG